MNKVQEYLNDLNKNKYNALDYQMKKYAEENNVPIIQDDGLMFLCQLISIHKSVNILEIGSAIGFSSINMAKYNKGKVTTIEIKDEMYNEALKNISSANFTEKIDVIHADALDVPLDKLEEKYDIIFIDASKSQYVKFFEKFEVLLNVGGMIITDNLLFHEFVVKEEINNRNTRQLVGKIKKYNEWLVNNENYDTYIYNIGDGLAVSIKR